MKTTPAKISDSEVALFKGIQSRPDEQFTALDGLRKAAGGKKKLPRRKVRARDSATLGSVVAGLTGDKDEDDPNNGHHGGTPADELPVAYGIGQPQKPSTTTVTQPKRAPGHAAAFRKPAAAVMDAPKDVKLSQGTGDDLKKQAKTIRRIHDRGPGREFG